MKIEKLEFIEQLEDYNTLLIQAGDKIKLVNKADISIGIIEAYLQRHGELDDVRLVIPTGFYTGGIIG